MYAFMADIHIGVKLPKSQFMDSLYMFLETIKECKEPCHAIFVCGDLFDGRLSVEDAKFAMFFMVNLVCNFCGKNGMEHVPVYFIHGTDSHDQSQYEIFTQALDKLPNAKVWLINKACEGTIHGSGIKALFLPQEYTNNYDELLNKKYDLIVGHGPMASQTKNPCKAANYEIIHSVEQLGSISKLCVFGHYHGYTDFGNGVYYTGPWLRWKYGEDEPRVFFFCDDNFKVFTKPNPIALEYETVEVHNPEELRVITSQECDHPRRFIIEAAPKDMETYRGIINTNRSDPNLKFKLTETVDEEDLQLTVDDVMDAQMEAVAPVSMLDTYIKDKYGIDTHDQLAEYEAQINKEDKKNE